MAEKDRVRTEQFRFTLLPEENAMLTKNAFEYGLSKSEYLRKLILAESLTGKQWHMDRDQAKQLIYEVNRIGNNVNQIAYNTNAVRFSSNKDWGELQTKYFELMTLFCQFALRENGEEKLWYKKILELMPEDDSSSVDRYGEIREREAHFQSIESFGESRSSGSR